MWNTSHQKRLKIIEDTLNKPDLVQTFQAGGVKMYVHAHVRAIYDYFMITREPHPKTQQVLKQTGLDKYPKHND